MIGNVEDAYRKIGGVLLGNAASPEWHSLVAKAPVLANECGGIVSVQRDGNGTETDLRVSFAVFDIQEAALFLRDDLLRSTGRRIWGLTFTLYPTGKFSIEYDYDRPEGYAETD